MRAIELKNINKKFNDRIIFRDLNISIDSGSFSCIIGQSGLGKSTLVNLITGITLPESGVVSIFNNSITNMSKSQRDKFRLNNLGIIFQATELIPDLNVFDNITIPSKFHNGYDNNRLQEIIKLLSIEHLLNNSVSSISGGERQRVGIARALLLNPKILIADEPTGNLDVEKSAEIGAYLKLVSQSYNLTIIVATHDPILMENADKIYDLNKYSEWV